MNDLTFEYLIGNSVSLSRAKELLRDELSLVEGSSEQADITYMDSFDWRMYSASGVIESEKKNATTWLRWRSLNGGKYVDAVKTKQNINFAADFPDGKMKKRLYKILKMRRLLPQVRLRLKRHHWVKLNKAQKTVLRVDVDDYQLWNEEKNFYHQMERRIRLIPVRGYQGAIDLAVKSLHSATIVEPTTIDIYLSALKHLGRSPGDYKPKSVLSLSPKMRADEATKLVLVAMLNMLEANEDGVINDIDPEFLHDFRIAVRKTRAAFGQIKGVFHKRIVERYRKQFAWLGSLTGPARDMDVYLLTFEGYQNLLPEDLREHLHPLRNAIVEKKMSSYKTLSKGLEGKRYRRLLKDYREFLDSPVPACTRLPNAARPVKWVADKRIWKMYRRAMKEGMAIGEESPDTDLHELRKTCKKLRYLIEFFQSLYDPEQMSHLIATLKKLQDNLGDFNDLHVQMGIMEEFLKGMMNEGLVSDETKTAIEVLIDQLGSLQKEKRHEFAGRFTLFCEKENKQLYRQLFKSE